jgi:enoyl-CoA hydratase
MMNYELNDRVAIISIDDNKANAVGHTFLDTINDLLDKAERDGAGAIILRGREGVFSGGFDLKEFSGPDMGRSMIEKGMRLLIRLYGYPLPVIAACSGHGIAMGAFLILACDTRIGVRGDFRITLPETALGMELPTVMTELTISRLSPHYLTRAAVQAEIFHPDQAVSAGFLDEVVEVSELDERALAHATRLAALPGQQYAANKLLMRKHALASMSYEFEQMVARFEEMSGA